MNEEKELVYVVARRDLFPGRAPHGFVRAGARLFGRIYGRGRFAVREEVEDDPSLKQIIPYAVVVRGAEVFAFTRSSKGGERRLHGLRSIGVGGHVNPVDRDDVIHAALRRELTEELFLPEPWRARVVGLMNNDRTPVGSVHLGIVAVVEVPPSADVKVRERDTMSGSFESRDRLRALHAEERDSFEGWSALLLDRFDEVLRWARPGDFNSPIPSGTRISTT